ncbi:MAG: M13 family metallopeptidase N-terminal domain-containing protein [Saprospiraceae bacterium]
MCEKEAAAQHKKGTEEQLVGDLYYSAMDSVTINKLGFDAIKEEYNKLDEIKSIEDITHTIAQYQKWGLSTPFYFFVNPDPKNSKIYAAQMWQGGTSLPSRSYYLDENPRFEKIEKPIWSTSATCLSWQDWMRKKPKANASTVFEMEKRFASAQRTPVQNRNPEKNYNKMTLEDLSKMTFNIDWKDYLETRGATQADYIIVNQPEFIAMFDRMLGDFSPEEWTTWFKWKNDFQHLRLHE